MKDVTKKEFNIARKYIMKIPGAVSGQGGHDQTFHVACLLVGKFSLDYERAFQHRRESRIVIDQVAAEFAKNHAGEDVCLISIHDCLVTTEEHTREVQSRLQNALRDELGFDVPVKIEKIS